jgi:hypothetical protein
LKIHRIYISKHSKNFFNPLRIIPIRHFLQLRVLLLQLAEVGFEVFEDFVAVGLLDVVGDCVLQQGDVHLEREVLRGEDALDCG